MPAWQQQIAHIQNGEAVDAAVTGRPDRALSKRTVYLKERLDEIEAGRSLIATDVPLDSSLLVGQPVHWNSTTEQFEAALAATETDSTTGLLVPTASSDVLGIVWEKVSDVLGHVALAGLVTVDLANAITDPEESGRYYLSPAEAGKLVKQRPAVSVPVLFNLGDGRAYILPAMRDFQEDHIHYQIELVCEPAGDYTMPAEGDRHTITSADAELPGWLPADHASFDGMAPIGAVFGYNLAAHTALDRLWPPIPTTAVALYWDKGSGHVGGTLVPLGQSGLVIINQAGIWWMSDCYGDVPWPVDFVSASSESSLSSTPECARQEQMRLTLGFAHMIFGTDRNVVTSLRAAAGSIITITNLDGAAATGGDLQLALNLALLVNEESDETGSFVLKSLSGTQLQGGHVVSGLIAGEGIELSSDEDLQVEIAGDTLHRGSVTVTAITDPAERELPAQLFRVGDVQERYYQDIPYLGMATGRASGVRIKFHVPAVGLPTTPQVKLRAVLLGRATGTFPDLDLSYRRIPRPAGSQLPLPTSDTALTFSPSQAITADNYIEVESDAFTVAAGDTLHLTLSRAASDGYSAEVGLLRVTAILISGD